MRSCICCRCSCSWWIRTSRRRCVSGLATDLPVAGGFVPLAGRGVPVPSVDVPVAGGTTIVLTDKYGLGHPERLQNKNRDATQP